MSEQLYLLDTNVLLFLARGGPLGQHIDAYVELDLVSQAHPEGARNMGKNELWVAASARAAGATLLTTDRDFDHLIPERLSGVVIDPKAAASTS